MGKRYLNCTASDILKMDSAQLIDAIAGSEGRLLMCETIGAVRPMLGDVTQCGVRLRHGRGPADPEPV